MGTILIVDDDPNARLLVQTVLAHAGHRVLEAADGRAGLDLAAAQRPDLVLLDLFLPNFGGTDFLRALRGDPRTADLAVALYTASAQTPALTDFMTVYRVAGRIPKPAEPRELIAAVGRALAASAVRDEKKL
jgi:CheY-like chemotaxis protein